MEFSQTTVYKDDGFQYEMKYSLANIKQEMHTTHLQLMQLLQFAITSLTSLFSTLITVDGTSHDSGPSGDGKTTLVTMKMTQNTQLSHGVNM